MSIAMRRMSWRDGARRLKVTGNDRDSVGRNTTNWRGDITLQEVEVENHEGSTKLMSRLLIRRMSGDIIVLQAVRKKKIYILIDFFFYQMLHVNICSQMVI